MKRKNVINIKYILVTCMLVFAMALSGCTTSIANKSDKIQVVCTLFPQYDWAREIIGDSDNVELILLVENGGDLHSYQPTANDIITISTCDIFIYGGGVSDMWVEDTLKQATNEDMIVINMLDVIGDNAKKEEVVEGMEGHDHKGDEHEDEGHNHESEEQDHYFDPSGYDEHLWLSITNAKLVCENIRDGLCKLDEAHKSIYEENLIAYKSKLDDLDSRYRSMVTAAKLDTIVVADRFPFRYLTSEYGINYYAAFIGCSSDTVASFETVTYLSKKVDELGLSKIIVVDGSTENVARTVIESTSSKDQTILLLDSMQSVGMNRINNGETYLTIMEGNLNVLEQALNN